MIIDFHVHPVLIKEALELEPTLLEAARNVFYIGTSPQPIETLLCTMEEHDIDKVVLLAIDARSSEGVTIPSNETIHKLVEMYPEKFLGFASVDPHEIDEAVEELERAINDLHLVGLKLSPPIQNFDPNDERYFKLYERAQELGIPLLFHCGFTWHSKSKISLSHPLKYEDIAMKFPELKIVLAHMGWPWVIEAVSLAMKYENVYLDLSNVYTGTPYEHLKYVLTEVVPKRIIERFVSDKILFGSDYPRMEPGKVIEALKRLPLSSEVKGKILGENAVKILSLS